MNRSLYILIMLVVVMLVIPQQAYSRDYVLCVGLSKYPKGRRSLRVSANDARVITHLFKNNGESQVALITDSAATKEAVLQGMKSAFANASSDDVVILYFSGHGTKRGLACFDGVLTFDKILDVMKQNPAHTKVIFADACYSGKMRGNKSWNKAEDEEEVLFFLSSRGEEPSRETKYSNSLFTIYLERGLRGGADVNFDRVITARELYDFCHSGVIKDSHGKQHPVMWGKFSDNMAIIKWQNNKKDDEDSNDKD